MQISWLYVQHDIFPKVSFTTVGKKSFKLVYIYIYLYILLVSLIYKYYSIINQ